MARNTIILSRDDMHKRGLCRRAVSVCLSVCLASVRHIRVLHQNLFSHLPVVIPVNFFRAKLYGNIPTGSPNGGVECRWI